MLLAGENLWGDNCYHAPGIPRGTWGGYYLEELVGYNDSNNYETYGFQTELYTVEKLMDYRRSMEGKSSWTKADLMSYMNSGVNHIGHLGHGAPSSAMKMGFADIASLTNDYYFTIDPLIIFPINMFKIPNFNLYLGDLSGS